VSKIKHSYAALHSAVLLFALSGLFAKWLNMSAIAIVIGRSFFAVVALFLVIVVVKKQQLKVKGKALVALMLTGLVLAFHWTSFFYSIQISSVAIGLITFATFPIFVSFLEPLFFKERFQWLSLVQALLTVLGIALILPLEQLDQSIMAGVYWGIASALTFALLTILNRKFVKNISAKKVAFYQNGFACLLLLPFLVVNPVSISGEQLSILILLGFVFTAFAHSLFNHALKVVKAQTASIAVSLEPIYGIIAAYFLLGEAINLNMVVGGAIVILTNVWALRANN